LVSALQILAVVVAADRPVSEVCRRFEPLPQVLENVRYEDGKPLEHDKVVRSIDDAKRRLGNAGRLVIRPSGTEPVIRVMAEGDDETLIRDVVGEIVEAVRDVATPAI
ncbi:MAG: phosphoglucosamine mutase, partial [Pseudomonadota bacterium]